MKSVIVKSYAKINLGLQIIGKRPDNFHNIKTIFQQLDLYDTIELEKQQSGCGFSTNVNYLNNDSSNLCVNAWEQFSENCHIGGVSIKLEKQIPAGSGLGGGSSNAAAILKGLCQLYDVQLSNKKLVSIATNIGADVPFFINGGLQEATGIGEKLIVLPGCIEGVFLLVIPNIHIDTVWAYSSYKKFLDKTKEELNFRSLLNREVIPFKFFENDFEKIVVPAYPEIADIKEKLLDCSPKFASLSGSGSTVYGIFDDEADARSAELLFPSRYKTFIVNPIASVL
tara:strand:- start:61 stop:909 length:849 start_codon:yes stop_codon:yes gene_type:complete